jgi:hypothetical protein
MSKFLVAEEGHVVNIIPPFGSAAATKDSDIFSMKNYQHTTIIIQVGTQAGSFTAILYECDDFTPTNQNAIATVVYKQETDAGDVLGAKTAVTTSGFNTAATSNTMYVIEVDGSQLSEGYPNLQLKLSALDNTTYISAVAILSGARYASPESPTEIA